MDLTNFWQALSAIGTMLAVFVSLYFAIRDRITRKKLNIYQQFKIYYDDGKIKIFLTIENLGNTPIIINEYGNETEYLNEIDTTINDYLVREYEPILIKAGDSILLEYSYSYNYKFKEEEIMDTFEYNLFKNRNFRIEDSAGNIYPKNKL